MYKLTLTIFIKTVKSLICVIYRDEIRLQYLSIFVVTDVYIQYEFDLSKMGGLQTLMHVTNLLP